MHIPQSRFLWPRVLRLDSIATVEAAAARWTVHNLPPSANRKPGESGNGGSSLIKKRQVQVLGAARVRMADE